MALDPCQTVAVVLAVEYLVGIPVYLYLFRHPQPKPKFSEALLWPNLVLELW